MPIRTICGSAPGDYANQDSSDMCHCGIGIFQSDARRKRSRPLYTVAVQISTVLLHRTESAIELAKVSSVTFVVTSCKYR